MKVLKPFRDEVVSKSPSIVSLSRAVKNCSNVFCIIIGLEWRNLALRRWLGKKGMPDESLNSSTSRHAVNLSLLRHQDERTHRIVILRFLGSSTGGKDWSGAKWQQRFCADPSSTYGNSLKTVSIASNTFDNDCESKKKLTKGATRAQSRSLD